MIGQGLPQTPPRSPFQHPDSPWLVSVGLAVALLIGLTARLWHLDSIPPVFFHDECDNTVNAIQILQGQGPGIFGLDWKPQPALAVHLIALSLEAAGPSVTSVRLPSALLSLLALLPFFFLARRLCGPVPALFAAVLLAVHPGYLHFSRSGWESVQICLWTLLAMEAVTRAQQRDHALWWVIAGTSAGVGAYAYFAGRVIVIFLLLYSAARIIGVRGSRLRSVVEHPSVL